MTTERITATDRFIFIDTIRGFAVILMVFFHLFFDLNLFQIVTIDVLENPFWFWLPRLIVSFFLICVGIGLALVHKNGIQWKHVWKRLLKIGGCALLVTCITLLLFPDQFIFFGVLHCIAVSSVLGLLFVKYPKSSLLGFFVVIFSYMIMKPSMEPVLNWFGTRPLDFIPIYPWFGVVLLGIFLESVHLHEISIRQIRAVRWMSYLGRHSLIIYLIHQPILFGLCYGIYKFGISSNS